MITINHTLQRTLSNFMSYLNTIHREISTVDNQGKSNFMVNKIILSMDYINSFFFIVSCS